MYIICMISIIFIISMIIVFNIFYICSKVSEAPFDQGRAWPAQLHPCHGRGGTRLEARAWLRALTPGAQTLGMAAANPLVTLLQSMSAVVVPHGRAVFSREIVELSSFLRLGGGLSPCVLRVPRDDTARPGKYEMLIAVLMVERLQNLECAVEDSSSLSPWGRQVASAPRAERSSWLRSSSEPRLGLCGQSSGRGASETLPALCTVGEFCSSRYSCMPVTTGHDHCPGLMFVERKESSKVTDII